LCNHGHVVLKVVQPKTMKIPFAKDRDYYSQMCSFYTYVGLSLQALNNAVSVASFL